MSEMLLDLELIRGHSAAAEKLAAGLAAFEIYIRNNREFIPPGLGRQTFTGNSILNTLPGIPGVPVGRALNFSGAPTLFTGADLVAILHAIRTGLAQSLLNADPTTQAIQLSKQATGNGVNPADYRASSTLHISLGVQREIARDFVLSADFAYRHFVHLPLGGPDLNHFNSARGPVVPVCTAVQRNDPQALCSLGPINVAGKCWPGDL